MDLYDLIIIGGGPAGYLAGERAGASGLRTLVMEKRALGGVCLNEGCIPSKAFLQSAKKFDTAKDSKKYGVEVAEARFNHGVALKRKNKAVRTLVAGVRAKLKEYNVEVVEASAEIAGKDGESFLVLAGGQEYRGKRLLIASGSAPMVPPIPGVAEGLTAGFVLTNREILDIEAPPPTLAVIGGGVIGLEMASYFSMIGCKVSVVEMLPTIAGGIDGDVEKILRKNLEKKGIKFHLGCKVTSVTADSVLFEKDGEQQSLPADKVLLSVGRKPVTEGLGLESIGLHTERGAVVTDEKMRTNVPNVYAAGDVNGKSLLAHTAYREAEVAVAHILGQRETMSYDAIPAVIYTDPEVAFIGETEKSAREKGYQAKEISVSMRYSGRYVAEVEGGDGICKLVVDTQRQRILGAHMIGSYVSEIIFGLAVMMEADMPLDAIRRVVFPHPTVSEIIKEALHLL